MALSLALAFRNKVDLQVSDVWAFPHEIMSYQPVEVEWRSYPGINLVISDLRLNAHRSADFPGNTSGSFQRTALRHVQNNLKLTLIVEGQHFDLNVANTHERHREQQQYSNAGEERVAPAPPLDDRIHEPPICPSKIIFGMLRMRMMCVGRGGFAQSERGVLLAPLQDADGRPRRDDERNCQREGHCCAGTDRNGAHVRSHEPPHECHWQDCCNYGKSR